MNKGATLGIQLAPSQESGQRDNREATVGRQGHRLPHDRHKSKDEDVGCISEWGKADSGLAGLLR